MSSKSAAIAFSFNFKNHKQPSAASIIMFGWKTIHVGESECKLIGKFQQTFTVGTGTVCTSTSINFFKLVNIKGKGYKESIPSSFHRCHLWENLNIVNMKFLINKWA